MYREQEELLKPAREKHQVNYKGRPIRITADFSAEIVKARRAWNDGFQALKKKKKLPP
jgi:hypothetical protein